MNKVYFGDCRNSMRQMAKDGIKVQTCITSPPYYGLRDYGTATWKGGDINCDHSTPRSRGDDIKKGDKQGTSLGSRPNTQRVCKCGAIRKDLQIGLEETPQEFIDNLVEVFACVWDILEDDGTLWVNLGDSYANNNLNTNEYKYKQKDLMGMPWRLAFALQDFGWYLRQDIIWHKPNPMPESVTDRCTKSHEYIFLLTKNQKYYFDSKAIQEPAENAGKVSGSFKGRQGGAEYHAQSGGVGSDAKEYEIRNKRNVWTVPVKPYSGAHFAVYPEELIEPCILAGSKVGDIVLDPFFGSGTTGQVSQNLGRKWIGCELNENYKKLQNERLSQQGLEL
jgi:site-specific DNA-methyltransferase (cytosine-N4-specific)